MRRSIVMVVAAGLLVACGGDPPRTPTYGSGPGALGGIGGGGAGAPPVAGGGVGLVSFATQVLPIFAARGCTTCHTGNGINRADGNLALDISPMVTYLNLTQAISSTFNKPRIDRMMPWSSLILTMPGPTPPGPHPVVVFTGTTDPDAHAIYNWIVGGATFN